MKNKINKTTNKKINFATGPARTDPAAREHALARPKMRLSPSWLPPEPQRLTRWTRASAKETGERRKTTAGLAVGGFSGETNGATVFVSLVRI